MVSNIDNAQALLDNLKTKTNAIYWPTESS